VCVRVQKSWSPRTGTNCPAICSQGKSRRSAGSDKRFTRTNGQSGELLKKKIGTPQISAPHFSSPSLPKFNQRGHCKLQPDLRNSTADIVLICNLRPLLFGSKCQTFTQTSFSLILLLCLILILLYFWLSLFISTWMQSQFPCPELFVRLSFLRLACLFLQFLTIAKLSQLGTCCSCGESFLMNV